MDRSRAVRRPRDHAGAPPRRPSPEQHPADESDAARRRTAPLGQRLLRQLQESHGNAHVQRTLNHVRAAPAATRAGQDLTIRRDPDKPAADPPLLTAFAADFPDSAAIIRKSAEALKLITEAQDAGSKYGGFSEDGPGKATLGAWPYTAGDSVYVPKAHRGDKITAMSDFLFELNNAIRAPKFQKIHSEAAKGSKGSLTAKTYAYQKVEQEVEGMLRLGQVWFEVKKQAKGKEWDAHDGEFYLSEYQEFKKGKKTKDDIIKDVLGRKYTEGASAGKTVEAFYTEQYEQLSGGK